MSKQLQKLGPVVVLESPYSGDIPLHVVYGQRVMTDSRSRGEIVIMPHMLWTQHHLAPHSYVDDWDEKYEVPNGGREVSLEQIKVLRERADKVIFYTDYGMSSGMQHGLDHCKERNIPYEMRTIGKDPMDLGMKHVRTGNTRGVNGQTLKEFIEDHK
jgi:hypothetical protein